MAEVDATEEVVPQQSVYGIASQQAERAPPPPQSAANTISLEDLMRISSVPSTKESEGWESDATSEMEEEVDEEQQERDRIEFMKAIRGLHGAPVAASTSAAPEPTKSSTLHANVESATSRGVTSAAAAEEAETPVPAKDATKREKQQLGRMFGDEGDVMEEHEREVTWLLP